MSGWNCQANTIFAQAIEIEEPETRLAFLEGACGDSSEVRAEVERLLRAHETAGFFLEGTVCDVVWAASEMPVGQLVGRYRLVERVGEGGFADVYRAQQLDPVRREVALKIVKPGMDTRAVLGRFEAERQALAMMDHANIAKVFDAGATETGHPYFVMELVRGLPITKYCQQGPLCQSGPGAGETASTDGHANPAAQAGFGKTGLPVRDRLELFLDVCRAVQHAHQKGIIHRDLKPSNILVQPHPDGRATVKVIDFGIAKATQQRLTERTLATETGQLLGTPEYMSPEQATFQDADVDTRSDIYSLGVLLYELLTGTTPFDSAQLRRLGYDEICRTIRETEPVPPSKRLTQRSKTSPASTHDSAFRARQGALDTDLDWIALKCLEKDRTRRYSTVADLAADVQRYLKREPVHAHPPSAAYRFRRYARRNRVMLVFASLLAVGLFVQALNNRAIRNERDAKTLALAEARAEGTRAQAVSDLLQEMLATADAERAKGSQYTVRELLDEFAARLGDQLVDQPAAAADIHATIGRAYRSLGFPERARPHFETAIALREQVDGLAHENVAAILADYAWTLENQTKYEEAETQVKRALDIYRQRQVSGAPVVHALRILQDILVSSSSGRDEEAERVAQEALAVAGRSDEEIADVATVLHLYADIKMNQGKFAEAEQLALKGVEMHRRLQGDHPETAYGLRTLGRALEAQQKLEEAEAAFRGSLVVFRRLYDEDHTFVDSGLHHLRRILKARRDRPALEELDAARSDRPENHLRLARILLSESADDRTGEARRLVRRVIEAYDSAVVESADDLDRRVRAIDDYAILIRDCASAPGLADEVEQLNRRLDAELPKLLAAFPDSSDCLWHTAMVYRGWAFELMPYITHRPTAARCLGEAIQLLEKLSLADPNRPGVWLYLADTCIILGETYWVSARPDDAEAAFARAMEIFDEHASEIAADSSHDVPVGITMDYLFLAYYLASTHREQEAAEWIYQAALNSKRLTEPLQTATALYVLALVQLRLGDEAGYRESCAALVDVPLSSADDLTKARTIAIWGLGPAALADLSLPVARAEELAADHSLSQPHFVPGILGAALYRNGQYERAAVELEKSIALHPAALSPNERLINRQRLFLAMTKWQLGQQEEARQLLAEAQLAVDEELRTAPHWILRIALEVLRREAEALIQHNSSDAIVEGDPPDPSRRPATKLPVTTDANTKRGR